MTDTRSARIERKTRETEIQLDLSIDGRGQANLDVQVPFLSHMLELFTKHGLFDLSVVGRGDVEVDDHHLTEDIGICLGQAIKKAIGDKYGMKRYGSMTLPMDETLVTVAVDLSDRPHLEWRAELPKDRVGTFDTENVHEFFWKLAVEARMNLHIVLHHGHNTHHIIEAMFKALARALDESTQIDPRVKGVPSTKGSL
ncbi:imidazoleglycerol-phosphate dehydratase [Halobacillus karajensis]|uniref:Imidazoleglycerol-phosphate dehydratase n=1 Tax=Halobacillus karajensis TaxID=195088 RepID=A0A059NWE2_9BACI|nr:imidazoleglycerol-phosphate dehydratase HisB [Halobacillus karajensis]CDQ19256.1 Imidazoleglycerol-phosphate dehydratase [Halobacillus karajensis]CDQ22670.1 Imidazoleglycerol-phosphate dehydratase [Halobacillus karajensis]CDQ26152.1 Imidazoleglycerol-phosphate dehydratase [Halobacillus karajensis]SEH39319.1 imidazoleglycerol-phosphate dehydratase [Halobacillus karajensis]